MDLVFDFCTEVVLYVPVVFRSSGIVILFLLGYGWNVWGLERFQVPFRKVLNISNHQSQSSHIFAAVKMGWATGASVMLVLFWVLLASLWIFSSQPTFKEGREFLRDRVNNLFVKRTVQFADVLAADALTSMSKLLADLQEVLCALIAITGLAGSDCMHSLVGPCLASLPYAIRIAQCAIQYHQGGQMSALINLGKYLSSFPVIWTSALRHHLASDELTMDSYDQHLQVIWLYAVTVNTLYSFMWDVVMDWGLAVHADSTYPLLRERLMFGNALYYYAAILGDLALRLCWSLKLSSHIQRHATGKAFVFLFEVLEVFRRVVWNFFRVEWECVRMQLEPATFPAGTAAIQSI